MPQRLIKASALSVCFGLGICAQILSLPVRVSEAYEPTSSASIASQELSGYYFPAKEFPSAFANTSRIDLTTADFHVNPDSTVTRTPIAPRGYLVTDYFFYKLSNVNVDNGRVSFTTEQIGGVSYEFTGRVQEGLHIEGRLVWLLFGFKVVEREVRFTQGSTC